MNHLTIDPVAAGRDDARPMVGWALPTINSAVGDARPTRPQLQKLALTEPCAVSAGVRRGLLALLDQGVVSGTSFVTSVCIGRICGQEALGLYSLGFTLLILVRGVQESLVLTPYTIRSARLPSHRRAAYAGSSLVHGGLAALASMLILGVVAVAVSRCIGSPRLAPVLGTLAALLPLMLLRECARKFLFAELHVGRALLLDVAVAGGQLALVGWLTATGRLSAVTALAAMGAACGLAAFAWLVTSRHRLRMRPRRVVADWGRNWLLGRWIFAEHVCGIANAYSPYWLLALLLGAAATGEFAAAMTIVLLSNPFIIGLGNLLGPLTARAFAVGGVTELRRTVGKFTLVLAAALLSFCLLVAAGGDLALKELYGPRYSGQGPAVALLALGLAAGALGMGADSALRAVDRPRHTFVASLLALTITLTTGACLVHGGQMLGAACAVLAGNLAGTTARWLAFARFSYAARSVGATA